MCVNPWGTIFFVCSKLEILFRKILCKCSQCWTKICYISYPLQSCKSGTGYNILWCKKSLYFPYYFTIFPIHVYNFLKNCPYTKPYIFAWGYFKPWIWHPSLTPIWHLPSPRDCTLQTVNLSCLWNTTSIPYFKKILEVDILFYILHSEITTLLHWVSLLNRLGIQVFNQTWYKPLSFSDGN